MSSVHNFERSDCCSTRKAFVDFLVDNCTEEFLSSDSNVQAAFSGHAVVDGVFRSDYFVDATRRSQALRALQKLVSLSVPRFYLRLLLKLRLWFFTRLDDVPLRVEIVPAIDSIESGPWSSQPHCCLLEVAISSLRYEKTDTVLTISIPSTPEADRHLSQVTSSLGDNAHLWIRGTELRASIWSENATIPPVVVTRPKAWLQQRVDAVITPNRLPRNITVHVDGRELPFGISPYFAELWKASSLRQKDVISSFWAGIVSGIDGGPHGSVHRSEGTPGSIFRLGNIVLARWGFNSTAVELFATLFNDGVFEDLSVHQRIDLVEATLVESVPV